jgi:DNA mismatch endonuclease (patch repair protein)
MTSLPRRSPNTKSYVDPVRSRIMRSVGRANTGPEITVRRAVHSLGLRFRLHRKGLPGTPDIVLPKHKTVIFVHGCFWHRQAGCNKASMPKTRSDFWVEQFDRNRIRDERNEDALSSLGWRVLIVWECETRNSEALRSRIIHEFNLS